MNDEYLRYIQSDEWRQKRKQAFRRWGKRCLRCGSDKRLEIHHKTYVRFGHERMDDLEVICHWCHSKEHGMITHYTEPCWHLAGVGVTPNAQNRPRKTIKPKKKRKPKSYEHIHRKMLR